MGIYATIDKTNEPDLVPIIINIQRNTPHIQWNWIEAWNGYPLEAFSGELIYSDEVVATEIVRDATTYVLEGILDVGTYSFDVTLYIDLFDKMEDKSDVALEIDYCDEFPNMRSLTKEEYIYTILNEVLLFITKSFAVRYIVMGENNYAITFKEAPITIWTQTWKTIVNPLMNCVGQFNDFIPSVKGKWVDLKHIIRRFLLEYSTDEETTIIDNFFHWFNDNYGMIKISSGSKIIEIPNEESWFQFQEQFRYLFKTIVESVFEDEDDKINEMKDFYYKTFS